MTPFFRIYRSGFRPVFRPVLQTFMRVTFKRMDVEMAGLFMLENFILIGIEIPKLILPYFRY